MATVNREKVVNRNEALEDFLKAFTIGGVADEEDDTLLVQK